MKSEESDKFGQLRRLTEEISVRTWLRSLFKRFSSYVTCMTLSDQLKCVDHDQTAL